MQNKTIREFADELSSKAHIPGGGAVAALSGVCSASLISMVINLTLGKDEFKEHEQKLNDTLAAAIDARDDLLDGMRRDAEAFDAVMTCYKMPKTTKEEKETRKTAQQEAFKKAASEPLMAMVQGRKLLDTARLLIPITNPNLVSDLGVAALNAVACSKSALLNVRINLPFIKDQEFVQNAESWIEETQVGIDEYLASTLEAVYSVINR